ncbi:MAG: PIN domain-containing protein [Armatimonadetes bacterium]|nr:PIN domain-containing protein [Armatimonadota bacterium]
MYKLLIAGDERVVTRVIACTEPVYVSTIAVEEFVAFYMNVINKARAPRTELSLPRAHADFAEAIESIGSLSPFAYSNAAHKVYQTFSAKTLRVGAQDCRIAAQAIAHGMTVITRNLRDFDAIGAPCADWSE